MGGERRDSALPMVQAVGHRVSDSSSLCPQPAFRDQCWCGLVASELAFHSSGQLIHMASTSTPSAFFNYTESTENLMNTSSNILL